MIEGLSSSRLSHTAQGPKCQATECHTLQRKVSLCIRSHLLNLCFVARILFLVITPSFKATGSFDLVLIRKSTEQPKAHSRSVSPFINHKARPRPVFSLERWLFPTCNGTLHVLPISSPRQSKDMCSGAWKLSLLC